MKTYDNIHKELLKIETLYNNAMRVNKKELFKVAEYLVKMQKEDGSFGLIDDYRIDADCAIEYGFVPTYYCAAILMKTSLLCEVNELKDVEEALSRALVFCERRKLRGSGFDTVSGLVKSLNIFINAGVFEWINKEENRKNSFTAIIKDSLEFMETALDTGRTVYDWQIDYKNELTDIVSAYHKSIYPEDKEVWYVAYGSNINEERFLEYINRCTDKTYSAESKYYEIPYSIYFAGKSARWNNAAVAFLDTNSKGFAIGRAYKITMKQLDEIQYMEGSKYDKRVFLGNEEGLPAFTFTSSRKLSNKTPDKAYLDVILKGLTEVEHSKSEEVLKYYLYKRVLSDKQIAVLKVLRQSEHGLSIYRIAEALDIPVKETGDIAVELACKIGIIKQDIRSVEYDLEGNDGIAVYYTLKRFRDIIDIINL